MNQLNYIIYSVHPVFRQTPGTPFKGTLQGAKDKALEILGEQGPGWTVKVNSDDRVLWSQEAR